MAGAGGNTAILVDPDVRDVGIDQDALVIALQGLGTERTMVVPGLARHPELLTAVVRASAAQGVVIVAAQFGHPPIAELRTWGVPGGLPPLGVQAVALDILRARRSSTERLAYAVRMVRAAAAALEAPDTGQAVRRPIGTSLSRRGLLTGRATTWVPVVAVDTRACLGTVRCERCVAACPQDALQIPDVALNGPPMVDVARCVACSGCLDVCPSGALRLDGHDPRSVARRLQALLQGGDGAAAPALVLSCQDAAEPVHRLGERAGLPGWLVLELPCLGGVGSAWHLAALAAGARTVQVLPCEQCRGRRSVTRDIRFTRKLLTAFGAVDADRRLAVLPAEGARLRRALRTADDLVPLTDGNAAGRMPSPDSVGTSARVAAWAVGELQRALGRPSQSGSGPPLLVQGEGAPLGVPRTAGGCTACGVCARYCPNQALSLSHGPVTTDLVLDPAACSGCGTCIATCPEAVLDVTPGVDVALLIGGCVPIAKVAMAVCPDCGEAVPPLPAATHLTPLPAELARRCPRCRQAALVATAGRL